MEYKLKNQIEYKLIGIILYFIFSLGGLSILFLFPPRELLFNNSEIDGLKQTLFKDFVKIVYRNLNKTLIKEMIISEVNKPCPDDFEELIIENEYHGNFTKFYGNSSFCIKRYENTENYFEKLLLGKELCDSGKIQCGKLNRDGEIPICFNNDTSCPLNNFNFATKECDNCYPIPGNLSYFSPLYEQNSEKPAIIDIEIISNDRLCLERHNIKNNESCEFQDSNQCFIYIGFDELHNINLPIESQLSSNNLASWNLENDNNINHNFCNKQKIFHIYAINYFNFTYENFQDFKSEFPSSEEKNNTLYLTCEAYKSSNEYDLLFYLLAFILLCWSLVHFILQICLYLDKKYIRKIYLYNGIILFAFKLLSFFGNIIYHYYFYLKIRKVYIILIDEPLNKLIQEYSSIRNMYITKTFIFWLIEFLVVCADLIVLIFTLYIGWGVEFKSKPVVKIEENKPIINELENGMIQKPLEKNKDSQNIPNFTNIPNAEEINNINQIENKSSSDVEVNLNPFKNVEEITLEFVCKEDLSKTYTIKTVKNESFNKVVQRLKGTYSDLKDKVFKVFTYQSNIINKDKTISENGLSDYMKIVFY